MAAPGRSLRHGDRVRAAICIALFSAGGRHLSVRELVAAVTALGVPLGATPNKTISDAMRWVVKRGHARRAGRAVFRAGTIAPSTLHYMKVRVAAYAIDPTQDCSRPSGGSGSNALGRLRLAGDPGVATPALDRRLGCASPEPPPPQPPPPPSGSAPPPPP